METKEKDVYLSCGDIEIASVLLANNHKLLQIKKQLPSRLIFCFQKRKDIENQIQDFYSGSLQINALAFSNARKNLKAMIHSDKNIF